MEKQHTLLTVKAEKERKGICVTRVQKKHHEPAITNTYVEIKTTDLSGRNNGRKGGKKWKRKKSSRQKRGERGEKGRQGMPARK